MTATPRRAIPTVLRGMGLIARGRAAGLNCFRDTPQSFLASLAPGFGIMVASVVEGLTEGNAARAMAEIPGTLCVLLAPSVLSYEMARFWGREAFWNRYIVAFNWCQWLLPVIAFALLVCLGLAQFVGVDPETALPVLLVSLAGYALWLNWFIARHGLALSRWRSAGLVATVNAGTMAIVFGPTVISAYFG
jgi:hypothetical protein